MHCISTLVHGCPAPLLKAWYPESLDEPLLQPPHHNVKVLERLANEPLFDPGVLNQRKIQTHRTDFEHLCYYI